MLYAKNRPLLCIVGFKIQTRAQKTSTRCPRLLGGVRVFWALVCILNPTRRGRILQKSHSACAGQYCLLGLCDNYGPQKRSSNASVTLQKRSSSGLHLLLGVFIHCGRFHGQWTRRCGALLVRARVCLAAAVCDHYPRIPPLNLVHPVLEFLQY
jgi:hypothetical protein